MPRGSPALLIFNLKKKEDAGFNSTINAAIGSIDNYGLSAQCNSNIEGTGISFMAAMSLVVEHDRSDESSKLSFSMIKK
jgi:hypothetical protein